MCFVEVLEYQFRENFRMVYFERLGAPKIVSESTVQLQNCSTNGCIVHVPGKPNTPFYVMGILKVSALV